MPKKLDRDSLPRDKLLILYQRITLNYRKHFQSDLAKELECSAQTIARLIDLIERHLGPDVHLERGIINRQRYYQLRCESEKRILGFSFEELHYLSLCRDLSASFLPETTKNRIDQTLTTLALELGEHLPSNTPIHFKTKGKIDYSPHLSTLTTLRTCIEKREICNINYIATGRTQEKTYRYAPAHILSMNGAIYVDGFRLEENSFLPSKPTTFSLHRIKKITPLKEFHRFNATTENNSTFGLRWHSPKNVRVQFTSDVSDYIRDRIWSDDQRIAEQSDGSLILSFSTMAEKEVNSWVMSFGSSAKLLKSSIER